MKKAQPARAFDAARDDPIVRHLLERAGLDQLPQGPGVGFPYGAPQRAGPRPSDVTRAALPEWCDKAARFAETYPELPLVDRTLAALADFATAERVRLSRRDGDAWVQELVPGLSSVSAALRQLRETPAGQRAFALAEQHAAAPDDPVFTRLWLRRDAAEFAFAEAVIARLQTYVRYRAQGPIPVDAADSRREAINRPVRPVGWTRVPDPRCGTPGQVAADVADYLAEHHRDGKHVWADIVLVLEFYGWDLGKSKVLYKARKLERAARRARARPDGRASAVPIRQV